MQFLEDNASCSRDFDEETEGCNLDWLRCAKRGDTEFIAWALAHKIDAQVILPYGECLYSSYSMPFCYMCVVMALRNGHRGVLRMMWEQPYPPNTYWKWKRDVRELCLWAAATACPIRREAAWALLREHVLIDQPLAN